MRVGVYAHVHMSLVCVYARFMSLSASLQWWRAVRAHKTPGEGLPERGTGKALFPGDRGRGVLLPPQRRLPPGPQTFQHFAQQVRAYAARKLACSLTSVAEQCAILHKFAFPRRDGTIKICDFGLSAIVKETASYMSGHTAVGSVRTDNGDLTRQCRDKVCAQTLPTHRCIHKPVR